MTGHLLPTAVMGALANVIPDRVRAAAGSPLWCVQIAGAHQGRRFASTLFLNGGQGAGAKGDGLPALSFPSNLANTPIEVIESQAPIRIVRRALPRGTGGNGRTRGGDGQVFEIDLLADEPVTMSFMADRLRTAAPGMRGGEPGVTGRVLLNGVPIDPRETVVAAPGSRLTLETPGGGGFGSVSERDEARQVADNEQQMVRVVSDKLISSRANDLIRFAATGHLVAAAQPPPNLDGSS